MIEFDLNKRNKTLEERGLDFEHSEILFAGKIYQQESTQLHGELRMITIGIQRTKSRQQVEISKS